MKTFRTSSYSSLLKPGKAPAETQKLYVRSVGYSFADSNFHEKPRHITYGGFYWCIRGSAVFKLDGSEHILNPGEIWFYPPGSLTDFQPQKEGMLFYWMALCGEALMPLASALDIKPGKRYCGAPPDTLWEQLIAEVRHAPPHRRLNILLIAMEILFKIAVPEQNNHTQKRETLIRKAQDIIEKEYSSSKFDINLLSSLLGIHPVTLRREFKKTLQTTPSEFLAQYRMKKALEMLESRQYLIKEIAEYCGFSSPEYFTNAFRAKFGRSPSAYLDERSETASPKGSQHF